MQAFDALGINIPSLVAFALNFFLLLVLLRLALYKPVLKMLDERSRRIRESLLAADNAAEQARESEGRVQDESRRAQVQGQEIVANAQEIARRIQDDANKQAEVQAAHIVEQAEASIRQETESARAALRREFADLTIIAAEKVINQSLDRESHLRLINEVLAEASAGRANPGNN